MLVVKIGGCNGSGKTTLVRELIKLVDAKPALIEGSAPKLLKTYVSMTKTKDHSLYICGSYENVCGGMDTISDKHHRFNLVKNLAYGRNIVLFEGLITGKTYGAFGALSEEKGHKGKWIYAFMDTSFNECVKRVLKRRKAAGNTAPFDPERTMRGTYKAVGSTAQRALMQGHTIYHIQGSQKPAEAAKHLLAFINSKI